jgi:hypothetical protein
MNGEDAADVESLQLLLIACVIPVAEVKEAGDQLTGVGALRDIAFDGGGDEKGVGAGDGVNAERAKGRRASAECGGGLGEGWVRTCTRLKQTVENTSKVE